MTDQPQPLDLAAIRARFEQTTHTDWRADTDMGRVLAEIDRLRAELQQARTALHSIESDAERAARKGYDLDAEDIRATVRHALTPAAASGCGCQTRVHPGHYPSCTGPAAVSGA